MPTKAKTVPMSPRIKSLLVSRLRTIEGHIRGIVRMVEGDAYCPEVLAQALAVERAIDSFVFELLEHHLETCFVTAIRGDSQQDREKALREILDIFQASTRLKKGRRPQGAGGNDGLLVQPRAPKPGRPVLGAQDAEGGCCS